MAQADNDLIIQKQARNAVEMTYVCSQHLCDYEMWTMVEKYPVQSRTMEVLAVCIISHIKINF